LSVEVWRKLEAATVRSLAALRDGKWSRVIGTVAATGELLTAPFTGRRCVMYEIRISTGVWDEDSQSWLWFDAGESAGAESRPFDLVDDTGRVGVEPAGAITDLVLPAQLRRSRPDGQPIAVREAIVTVGDRITLGGVAVAQPDPTGAARVEGYRGDAPMRLVISGSARAPLLITNLPRLSGS
jgi:hypothetical protein